MYLFIYNIFLYKNLISNSTEFLINWSYWYLKNSLVVSELVLNDIYGIHGLFKSTSQDIGFILLPSLENSTIEVLNKKKRKKKGRPNTEMWK